MIALHEETSLRLFMVSVWAWFPVVTTFIRSIWMLKKFVLVIGLVSAATSAFAAGIMLAPVDPLAFAVASNDWGPYGGPQLQNLRKVVNGQVLAHQTGSSYTDPETHVIKRTKCFDPSNCVMCSPQAMDYGKKMLGQLKASSGAGQATGTNMAALATYYDQQARAMKDRELLAASNAEFVVTETSIVDGQEVTTTKTVTLENTGSKGVERAKAFAQQLKNQAAQQQAQQGVTVYSYITAATETLQTPKPAIEMYVSNDPLR